MPKLVQKASLEGHEDRVWQVCWSPSGNLLASCGGDKTIRIWQAGKPNWTCKATLENAHQRTIRGLSWSPDGKFLAAASFDATTSVWEYKNGFVCIATLEGHENEVKSVAWDISGSLLATCSRDKTVWIWSMEADNEFECISVLNGHTQDVKSVLWHPVKEALVSCGYDDTIRIWQDEEDDWYNTQTLTGHTGTVWDIAFDKEGDRLVSCSDDLNVIIWDTKLLKETPKKLCTLTGYHKRTIFSVDWSQSGLIATGSADDAIRVFVEDDNQSYVLATNQEKAHDADVNCVRWNPEIPNLLASCSDDKLVKLWEYVAD